MGYDFYITRAANWFESETDPISRSDWEELAARRSSNWSRSCLV